MVWKIASLASDSIKIWSSLGALTNSASSVGENYNLSNSALYALSCGSIIQWALWAWQAFSNISNWSSTRTLCAGLGRDVENGSSAALFAFTKSRVEHLVLRALGACVPIEERDILRAFTFTSCWAVEFITIASHTLLRGSVVVWSLVAVYAAESDRNRSSCRTCQTCILRRTIVLLGLGIARSAYFCVNIPEVWSYTSYTSSPCKVWSGWTTLARFCCLDVNLTWVLACRCCNGRCNTSLHSCIQRGASRATGNTFHLIRIINASWAVTCWTLSGTS